MKLTTRTLFLILLYVGIGACTGDLTVSGNNSSGPAVDSVDRLSALPGETVSIRGQNLNADLEAWVNGQQAEIQSIEDKSVTIKLPASMEPGLLTITITSKQKAVGQVTLMNRDSVSSMTPASLPLESICSSQIVKNKGGDLVRGKAICTELSACARDGETSCVTTSKFAAVEKATLPEKILTGKSVAGVDGQASKTCND